jgi:uncharacterized protein (DUF952 family)/glycine/D-amino acid oxidase-like deaminating enzyme
MYDYLIIGQGIAGTVLSYTLLQKGKKIKVMDNNAAQTASKASSGVCNPITGRRLVKTWKADEIFPLLNQFYQALAQEIQSDFFHSKQVYRPFASIKDQNEWFARSSSQGWDDFVNTEQINHAIYHPLIDNPFGGWETKQATFIDCPQMLKDYRAYLQKIGIYDEIDFEYADLRIHENSVTYQGNTFQKVIFCEGYQVKNNPFFDYLPYRYDKGEWIKVRIHGLEKMPENMLKQHLFMIPLGNQNFLVSGTYQWNETNPDITPQAREELESQLKKLIKLPFEVIDQQAGIRTATLRRRPFVGSHPRWQSLIIFNGFGTKGLSLTPYFAGQLFEYLELGKALDKEVEPSQYPAKVIYHLCPKEDWQKAQAHKFYTALSLESEGFIHCSQAHQVIPTAQRFFKNQEDLAVLHIDTNLIGAELKYEKARDVPDLFPHIYGALNIEAVVKVSDLKDYREDK